LVPKGRPGGRFSPSYGAIVLLMGADSIVKPMLIVQRPVPLLVLFVGVTGGLAA